MRRSPSLEEPLSNGTHEVARTHQVPSGTPSRSPPNPAPVPPSEEPIAPHAAAHAPLAPVAVSIKPEAGCPQGAGTSGAKMEMLEVKSNRLKLEVVFEGGPVDQAEVTLQVIRFIKSL